MGIKVLALLLALVAEAAYGRPGYGSISLGSGQGLKGNAGFGYSGTKTPRSGSNSLVDITTNELGGNAYGQHNGHYGSSNQNGVTGNSDLLGAVNASLEDSNHVNGEAHSEAEASSVGGASHGNRDNSVLAINLDGYGANSNGSSESNVAGHSGGSLLGDGEGLGFVGNEIHEAVRVGHIRGTSGTGEEAGVNHGTNSVLGGLSLGGKGNEAGNGASGNSVLGGHNVGHTDQASGLNFGGNGILNAHSYGWRDQSAGGDLLSVVNGSLSSTTDGYHANVDGEAAHSVTEEAGHGSNSVLGGHGSGSNVLTGFSSSGSSDTNANDDAGHCGRGNLLGDVSGDNSQSVDNDVQEAGHEVSHGSNSVLGLGLGGNTNGAANGDGGHRSSHVGHNDQRHGIGGLGTSRHASYSSNSVIGTYVPLIHPSFRANGTHTYPSTGGTLDNTFASNSVSGNVHPSNQDITGFSQVSHGNHSVQGLSVGGETNGAENGESSQGSTPSGNPGWSPYQSWFGNQEVSHGRNSVPGLGLDGSTNGAANGEGSQGSSQSGNSTLGHNIGHNEQRHGLGGLGTYRHVSYPSNSVIGTYVPLIHPSFRVNGTHTYPSTGGTLDNTFARNGVSGNVHPSNQDITGFSQVSHGNHSVQGLSVGGETNGAENGDSSQGSTPSGNPGWSPYQSWFGNQEVSHGSNSVPGLGLGRSTNGAANEGGQGSSQSGNSTLGPNVDVNDQRHGRGGLGTNSGHTYPSSSTYGRHTYPSEGGITGGYVPVSRGYGYGSSGHVYPAGQNGRSGSFSDSPGFASHGYGSGGNALPDGQSGISSSFSNSPGYGSHENSFSGSINAGNDE